MVCGGCFVLLASLIGLVHLQSLGLVRLADKGAFPSAGAHSCSVRNTRSDKREQRGRGRGLTDSGERGVEWEVEIDECH